MTAIETDGLGKRYGDNDCLADVTLAVEEGRILGLLGPNGAGKTTLIRLLLGLATPTSGTGQLLGSPIPPNQHALAQTGAMVEEPSFYPWMTADEHLRIHALTAGGRCPRTEIASLLDRVGLADAGKKKVKRFSQGMRQRLGLARALLRAPRLLVLDEPANGLDPSGIVWLRALIRDVAAQGTTVLVSSHQLGEIERVSDDVIILDRGRVVEAFSMSALADEPRGVTITVDLGDHEAAAAALAATDVVAARRGVFRAVGYESADLVKLLADNAVYPMAVEAEQRSLERRFLETIGSASS